MNPTRAQMGFGLLAVILAFALFLMTGCDDLAYDRELQRMKEATKQMELRNADGDKQREFERHKFDERVRLCEKFVTEHHIPGDRNGIHCGLGQ